MTQAFWVLGTGTDVGKTALSAAIIRGIRSFGMDCGYFKPVATGALDSPSGPVGEDAAAVALSCHLPEDPSELTGLLFRFPASPHLSAALEGRHIGEEEESLVRNRLSKVMERHSTVLIEGAGGVAVPLSDHLLSYHWVARWGFPAVLVSPSGLGALSHLWSALWLLRSVGIRVRCVVMNRFDPSSIIHRDNLRWVERSSGLPVIAVPEAQGDQVAMAPSDLRLFMEVMRIGIPG